MRYVFDLQDESENALNDEFETLENISKISQKDDDEI